VGAARYTGRRPTRKRNGRPRGPRGLLTFEVAVDGRGGPHLDSVPGVLCPRCDDGSVLQWGPGATACRRGHLVETADGVLLLAATHAGGIRKARPGSAAESGGRSPTFREAVSSLGWGLWGDYLVHRFSDPTFVAAEAVLRSPVEPPGPVLDLCCGAGHASYVLEQVRGVTHVTAVDKNLDVLSVGGAYLARGARRIWWDADEWLPFPSETFARVFCIDALHYVNRPCALVREVGRVLRGDGIAFFGHVHHGRYRHLSAGSPVFPEELEEAAGPLEVVFVAERELLRGALKGGVVSFRDVKGIQREPVFGMLLGRVTFGREWKVPRDWDRSGELRLNPLYRRLGRQRWGRLAYLRLPSVRYAREYWPMLTYLPLVLDAGRAWSPEEVQQLGRRRVLLRLPAGYV
jgi:SAM-dependent methyltransferase